MRKVKRKYTRKTVQECPQDAPGSPTGGVKAQSSGIIPPKVNEADILPPSLRLQLDTLTRLRARHGIPDNLKERTEQMVKMFRGEKTR